MEHTWAPFAAPGKCCSGDYGEGWADWVNHHSGVLEVKMVEALIERMDEWLAVNRPACYNRLQPDVADGQLDGIEVKFSLKVPHAFPQLYRCLVWSMENGSLRF